MYSAGGTSGIGQRIIDHLASEVLHLDLSHIQADSVIDGNPVTISYLVEILTELYDIEVC